MGIYTPASDDDDDDDGRVRYSIFIIRDTSISLI